MDKQGSFLKAAKDLRNSIVEVYNRAGKPIFNTSGKIVRVTNRATSDLLEELIADFIACQFLANCDDQILINQSIRVGDKTRRPDLAWCAPPDENGNRKVRALFEIKADMGFDRDSFESLPAKLADEIKSLQGCTFKIANKRNSPTSFSFPKKARMFLILVAAQNSGKGWRHLPIGVLQNTDLQFYRFFEDRHPNLKKSNYSTKDVRINEETFVKFYKAITRTRLELCE